DEVAGGLAGHYLAAYRNSAEGAEADAVAAQARISLTAAAQRAAELGSHLQAVTFLEQALSVSTDPADTARLHQLAGETATTGGRYEVAEAHLRRAVELQREHGERDTVAGAIVALGRMLIATYRNTDAISLLEPALDEFPDISEAPVGVAVAGLLARAYFL